MYLLVRLVVVVVIERINSHTYSTVLHINTHTFQIAYQQNGMPPLRRLKCEEFVLGSFLPHSLAYHAGEAAGDGGAFGISNRL